MDSPRTNWPLPDAIAISPDEIGDRLRRLRDQMNRAGLGALILTSRENVEYATGFRTLSWSFNSRPIFAIIGMNDVAVICSASERRTLLREERAFQAVHYSGFLTEAVTALGATLRDFGLAGRQLGLDYGQDMLGRGSLELIETLAACARPAQLVSGAQAIWAVRMIKSRYEADLKRKAFAIANAAFDEVVASAHLGMSERDFSRSLHLAIHERGAERSEAFTLVFGQSELAYTRWPGERRLEPGDYVWTDFRCGYGGYPADRNRIARAGEPSSEERVLYAAVRTQTIALCQSIRAGQTGGDVYRRFEALWAEAGLGLPYGAAGRIGHGGGLDGGEPPSLAGSSEEVIREGMILHVEPKIERLGGVFQFEEIVFVGAADVEFLSELSPAEMPVIGAG